MTITKSDPDLTAGSTTQCHSEGYLEARLVQEGDTEPHRASEIAARLADHPSQEKALRLLGQVNNQSHNKNNNNSNDNNNKNNDKRPDTSEPHTTVSEKEISALPFTLQDLSIRELSPATRCVIVPAETLGDSLPTQQPHGNSNIPEDVFIVCQSSEAAWYDFTSERLSFQLFYDPASDNLVFVNHTQLRLSLDALNPENTESPGIHHLCLPRQRLELSPGVWRASDADRSRTALCDFLLLRRTYAVEAKAASPEAGSKRRISGPSTQLKKRQLEHNRSLVLVNPTPVKGSSGARLTVTKDGNPLHDVQPGMVMSIKPPSDHGNGVPIMGIDRTDLSEHYSISNMRDIVTTAAASIFYGRHSVHGVIAVKSLRQAPSPTRPVVPTFAQYWDTEKRLLQHVNHRSIVRFIDADARFFSIYMEYLPYPDLTGLMTKPGYFFTGSLEDATCILRDMSSALAYLEEKDILHNDIKPANILYDDSRGAVLIDFGLASFSGKVCNGGTPWYVPQEFMAEGKRGFASDVFALGVTGLYLLKRSPLPDLQGRPWAIRNATAHSDTDDAKHMKAWLANVQTLEESLDESNQLEAIVRKMLQSEPKYRLTASEAYKTLSC